VWCGVVWCGVVWCGVVWCGVVWCGVVRCGVVRCGVGGMRLARISLRVRAFGAGTGLRRLGTDMKKDALRQKDTLGTLKEYSRSA
jgi:hypothetical protein